MFAMISQNDLYDMSFALVLIRNNIQYDLNSVVVSKIEQVLKNNSLQFEDNQFRKALATIDNLDYTKWYTKIAAIIVLCAIMCYKNIEKKVFSESNRIKETIINGSFKVPTTEEELNAVIESEVEESK